MIDKSDSNATITEEEAELYDRQIRLWGLDSQKRLRQAKILIFGLGGLGVEVAKNVVLAGVKSLCLMDTTQVTNTDVATNFTLTESHVGQNRAEAVLSNIQKLNPMVQVNARAIELDENNAAFFKQFDIVCITGCSQSTSIKVNNICADNGVHFISGDCFGFYGYAFFDLGDHQYSEEVPQKPMKKVEQNNQDGEPESKKRKVEQSSEGEMVTIKKTIKFERLEKALQGKDTTKKSTGLYDLIKVLWTFKDEHGHLPEASMSSDKKQYLEDCISRIDKSLQSKPALNLSNVLTQTMGDFTPSIAIVGGIIGQEVIKAVSQKDAPLNNFFLFDGTEGCGYVQKLGIV